MHPTEQSLPEAVPDTLDNASAMIERFLYSPLTAETHDSLRDTRMKLSLRPDCCIYPLHDDRPPAQQHGESEKSDFAFNHHL